MLTTSDGMTSYQKLVNRVAVPSFSRRSFRPRERYLILLVFVTFTIVCFGAFFYLPEYRGSSSSGSESSVYKMYQTMQKAGPNLLIPAPPYDGPTIIRHDGVEPHGALDRAKFVAKLKEHDEQELSKNYGVRAQPFLVLLCHKFSSCVMFTLLTEALYLALYLIIFCQLVCPMLKLIHHLFCKQAISRQC